jgi:hypothetical protein
MRNLLTPAVVAAALLVVGCNKGPKVVAPVPHDSPPTFDANTHTVATFIEGKWCPSGETDPNAVEKFGIEANSEIDLSQFWEFKPDGTFSYGKTGYDDRITGTWMLSADGVGLNYEKWGEETITDRRNRLKKAEETGAQAAIVAMMAFDNTMSMLDKLSYLELSEDGKGLEFTTMGGGSGGGGMFDMLMGPSTLVRMK